MMRRRDTGMSKLKAVLCSYLIVGSFASGLACYDAASPSLPPCPPGVGWPDPCYSRGTRPSDDAGSDADAGTVTDGAYPSRTRDGTVIVLIRIEDTYTQDASKEGGRP